MPPNHPAAILDKHIAPGVSSFTTAQIPDMSNWACNSRFWIESYFVNSVHLAQFAYPMSAYTYNFLRRTQYAFSERHLARESTLAFLSAKQQSPTVYATALFHWECFLAQTWHAFALLVTAWKGRPFDRNDGSREQRLNALYNQMKHVESRINNDQMPEGATVPVWLENSGLRSIDTRLSYAETAGLLKDLAEYADVLSDPSTAHEKLSRGDALYLPEK